MGLKGVRRGLGDFRGLQGVSAGYRGLQRDYKKSFFFLARTSKDTFSSYILKKN